MAITPRKDIGNFHQVSMCHDKDKKFYVLIEGRNGEEIYRSTQSYTHKQSAEKALRSLMRIFGCTSVIINDRTANEAKCIHSS